MENRGCQIYVNINELRLSAVVRNASRVGRIARGRRLHQLNQGYIPTHIMYIGGRFSESEIMIIFSGV